MSKTDFIKLAQKIYINLNPEVMNSLMKEYEIFQKNLDQLKKIDITNVEPMTKIGSKISFDELRSDEITLQLYLCKESMLNNAYQKNNDFVVIKRILK